LWDSSPKIFSTQAKTFSDVSIFILSFVFLILHYSIVNARKKN